MYDLQVHADADVYGIMPNFPHLQEARIPKTWEVRHIRIGINLKSKGLMAAAIWVVLAIWRNFRRLTSPHSIDVDIASLDSAAVTWYRPSPTDCIRGDITSSLIGSHQQRYFRGCARSMHVSCTGMSIIAGWSMLS